MGAAPPRQTEIRFKVPGASFQEQYEHAMSAFSAFDIPAPPEQALEVIRSNPRDGLAMSVITSSEGFVRMGLLAPKPDAMTVEKLCSLSGALNSELLHSFEVHVDRTFQSIGSALDLDSEYFARAPRHSLTLIIITEISRRQWSRVRWVPIPLKGLRLRCL